MCLQWIAVKAFHIPPTESPVFDRFMSSVEHPDVIAVADARNVPWQVLASIPVRVIELRFPRDLVLIVAGTGSGGCARPTRGWDFKAGESGRR
jgi:hypothetical protein